MRIVRVCCDVIYALRLSVVPGTNRALLCKSSSDGQNQVLQIGRPHSTDNEEELQRLAALGERISILISIKSPPLQRGRVLIIYEPSCKVL